MSDEAQGNGLTRREVLRVLGAATGLAYLGSVSGCGSLWQRQPVIMVDTWHKGGCRFCGTGCGMMIGVTGGKVVDVKGDEDAHNRGRLCIKGLMNKEILYTQDRALYPMIRKNGELVRATWDEAMTVVADRFRDAIAKHGPDSVAYYGSGQLYTQETYTANKLFKAGIGTNNVDGNPRLCMASAVTRIRKSSSLIHVERSRQDTRTSICRSIRERTSRSTTRWSSSSSETASSTTIWWSTI